MAKVIQIEDSPVDSLVPHLLAEAEVQGTTVDWASVEAARSICEGLVEYEGSRGRESRFAFASRSAYGSKEVHAPPNPLKWKFD